MAHYIDDDIVTSRHLLASRETTVRSRTGLTKRRVSKSDKDETETTHEENGDIPEKETKEERAKREALARREAIKLLYVKQSKKQKYPRTPFGLRPPKDLAIAWKNVPLVSRILVTGVLLTILALTTPFWAYVRSYNVSHATFGLWHFCIGSSCWSIHDNLIHGRDVPLWYMVSQMTFTIGVICATLAMFVVTSNHRGNQVKLSPTTNSTMVMMLVVGVLQMSTGLYTFTSYFEDVSFMYEYSEDVEEVDFYGAFWLGVMGTILILIAAMMLFFDEEIMPYHEKMMFLHGEYPPGMPCFPPEYTPDDFIPKDYQGGGYLPDKTMMRGKTHHFPEGYPPMAGYPYEAYMSDGQYRDNNGQYPAGYYPPGYYPDNALFSDMSMWDEQARGPIMSQQDIPCSHNPTQNKVPRGNILYEDFLKKST